MDRRTFDKWHFQMIIAKDVGIIVVCSHENIHVHKKNHTANYDIGIVY